MATASTQELAVARVQRAERLQHAIEAAGRELDAFTKATRALEFRTNLELERYVQNAIVLHLAKAGFGPFLESKIAGVPPSLRQLVEQQHRRTNVYGLRAEPQQGRG